MIDINFKDKGVLHRYANVAEYYHEANQVKCQGSSRSHGGSWSGSDSFDETVERYQKGYRKGTDMAREISLKLTPFLRTVQGTRRGWRPQRYAGGNFIIDNYVRGLPDLCSVMIPVPSRKFASLILNGTASAGIGTDIMQRRGVATLALCQCLEANGYRVAIKLAYGIAGSQSFKQFCIIDVKPFNQTIELDRLAFFLGDPSAFRRLHFSWMEAQPDSDRRATGVPDGGYGMPIELLKTEIGANDIYLGCANLNDRAWSSLESTQAWIKETLKRYGIEFHGRDYVPSQS